MRTRIALLGSTGSIGVNTLDVVRRHKDRFEVVLLTAYNNTALLKEQIQEFKPRCVALAKDKIRDLSKGAPRGVRFFDAEQDLSDLVAAKEIDVVVLAMTGALALDPFLSAVKAGKTVAPANKEALVMAGEKIMTLARKHGARVIPVDSEQSAIFQCLEGHRREDVVCVHLTASGGALRKVPPSRHAWLTVQEVLRHPRWRMGAKITVDSATLMNKGFEVIEAMRLFDLSADEIKVLVHPEAIIHSMVEYKDGALMAQMGITDMRIPIQYALSYPQRLTTGLKSLDLTILGSLTFEKPDLKAFPSLALAYTAARSGGTLPAVLNAADEVAVEAFLKEKIGFHKIYPVVEKTVRKHLKVKSPSLTEIRHADAWARAKASEIIKDIA